MSQFQKHAGGGKGNNDDSEEFVEAGQAQINTQGVDDILDDIDSMLETNAEDFVRNFVQKGGQ
ncbi:ubiquitin-like protein Pup [Brevibacterium sp. ACRRH]|uniref:ubiquitin-like protein Pup n=1 Tax=Brevibacterium sp. ACRRH TaxID=2918183 RepID=UPI001EF3DBA5|nr:ubiquitin-like protein Pup [Brevibacterium sp. ACRRH]MCG7299037.1 ubiquitin-like protein Pup [Brevibacterium sp. ACRRH]